MHSFNFASKTPLTFRKHKNKFLHFVSLLDQKIGNRCQNLGSLFLDVIFTYMYSTGSVESFPAFKINLSTPLSP